MDRTATAYSATRWRFHTTNSIKAVHLSSRNYTRAQDRRSNTCEQDPSTHFVYSNLKYKQTENGVPLEVLATRQRHALQRPPAPADQPGAAPPFAGQRAAPEEQRAAHHIEHLSSPRTPRPSRIHFVTAGHRVPPLRLPYPEPPTRCSSRHRPPLQQPSVPSPSPAAQSPHFPSRSAARKSPDVLGTCRRRSHTAAENIPGI